MHGRVAAAPAAPSPASAEGPQRPGQVIGLVPMVEARAFGLGHLGADREIGFGHRRSGADVRIVDREADLQRDLVVLDLAGLEMAAGLGDLEPAQVAQGAAGARDSGLYCVLDAGRRRAGDPDYAV